MPTLPVDIVNRALDECHVDEIGDLQEGSKAARMASRVYWPTLRQMLSGAHWNFARKQDTLNMLADLSGQLSPDKDVPAGWGYMYEWPTDCVHARWVPSSALTATDDQSAAIFGVSNTGAFVEPQWPVPFIVMSSSRPNPIESQWDQIEGHDPESTRVILTNQPNARLTYTGLMQYPDAWDPLFEQAMVAGLAVRFATLIDDPKQALVIRRDNVQIAMQALNAARVRDGNEGWTVRNHTPDWIRARYSGGSGSWGYWYNSWNTVSWLEAY